MCVVFCCLLDLRFLSVLRRYEVDGAVESSDEILGILSMCYRYSIMFYIVRLLSILNNVSNMVQYKVAA